MVSIEPFKLVIHIAASSGIQDYRWYVPRGAMARLNSVKGSIAISGTNDTAWTAIVAIVRQQVIQSSFSTVGSYERADVLWSKILANADLGSSTTHIQVNSFDVDFDFKKDEAVFRSRAGSPFAGFSVNVESDTFSVPVNVFLTINGEIEYPTTKATKTVDRTTRTILMANS